MINKCILPLNESTPVSYNLLFAIPLKIALSDLEIRNDVDNWIYSNYIQLLCFSKEKHRGFSRLNFFESYNPFVKRSLNIILNKKRKPDFYNKKLKLVIPFFLNKILSMRIKNLFFPPDQA